MVTLLVLAARVLLSVVFLVAGLGKLLDRDGSRQAVSDFGIPAPLLPTLALLLPAVELATSLALLVDPFVALGAIGAVILLLLFIGAISVNLAQGKRPECRCFGQIHSEPAGWSTLGRNAVLLVLSGLVLWKTPLAGLQSLNPHHIAHTLVIAGPIAVLALGLALALTWLTIDLSRRNQHLEKRLATLEEQGGSAKLSSLFASLAQGGSHPSIGAPSPAISLPDLTGRTLSLQDLLESGRPLLLLFADPHCGPCATVLPLAGKWQQENSHRYSVVVISRGSVEENLEKQKQHGVPTVLLQTEYETADAFGAAFTPSAVLLDAAGIISSHVMQGAEAIEAFLRTGDVPRTPVLLPLLGTAPPVPQLRLPVGMPAPSLNFITIDDQPFTLADYRDRAVVLLFWDTDCGFCKEMLPHLQAWDQSRPSNAPDLVVISRGMADQLRAMELTARVVSDPDSIIPRTFGAAGTPMAVLIDEQQRIGSPLAEGMEQVMLLLKAPSSSVGAA